MDWYIECSSGAALGLSMEGIVFVTSLSDNFPLIPLGIFVDDMARCENEARVAIF